METELRPIGVLELTAAGHAEIRVQVPHRDAKRHARVQFVFGRALGHGVHCADELVAGGSFFVEKGSRARSVDVALGRFAFDISLRTVRRR